jgi:hypothetical protein
MIDRIKEVNHKIELLKKKYREDYNKAKVTEGWEREFCLRRMERYVKQLRELLAEKRKLKGA